MISVKKPIATIVMPNSILGDVKNLTGPVYAGNRLRFSTCSGVSWFPGAHAFVTINLLGGDFNFFKFHAAENRIEHVRTISDHQQSTGLVEPENVSLSSDGKIIAVSSLRIGRAKLFRTDPQTLNMDIRPIGAIGSSPDDCIHGVSFSPQSDFVAYTSVDDPARVGIYRCIDRGLNELQLEQTQILENPFEPSKPKSISFSPDQRFVCIGYSTRIGYRPNTASARIAVHSFDKRTGVVSSTPIQVVGHQGGVFSTETITFSPDGNFILATDQINDQVTIHKFDPINGKILGSIEGLTNPDSEISFPHGLAFSSDGQYLAVTNYGDDKVSIYELKKPEITG